MKKRQKQLREEYWQLIEPWMPRPRDRGRDEISGAVRRRRIELVSKAFCGFCRPVRPGVFSPTSSPRPRPAGGVCNAGKRKASGWQGEFVSAFKWHKL